MKDNCASADQYVTRADAARPVPADVLEKCARLLGWAVLYRSHTGQLWHVRRVAIGAEVLTDGALLQAIFAHAAKHHIRCDMTIHGDDGSCRVIMDSGGPVGYGANMLEAALLAFAQLEPPHDR